MLAGHVLTTYLVFAVVKKLTNHRTTAIIAGLLFGLHPVHVENVAWLSSVGDLLMSALLVGSFLAYLKFRERGETERGTIKIKTKMWIVVSLLLFTLALLSKETATVFPLLILAFAITQISQLTFDKASLKLVLCETWVSIPYFIILAGYLAIRIPMLHGVASPTTPLPWTTMLFTWPSAIWFDVKHLLLPLSSSEFYSLAYVTKPALAIFYCPFFLWWSL